MAAKSKAVVMLTRPQARTFFMVEFGAILLGSLACIWIFKREPFLSVHSLLTIVFSMTTGVAQGMYR